MDNRIPTKYIGIILFSLLIVISFILFNTSSKKKNNTLVDHETIIVNPKPNTFLSQNSNIEPELFDESTSEDQSASKDQSNAISNRLAEIETRWKKAELELGQSIFEGGYSFFTLDELKELAKNGDGIAAITYIAKQPKGLSETEALEYVHIGIRENLLAGYHLAAEIAINPNKKIAYMLLGGERNESIQLEEVKFFLKYVNFMPKPDMDKVNQILSELRKI